MVYMQVLFPRSIDSKVIDRFVAEAEFFKQARGFRSMTQSEGDIMSPLGPPPFSKVMQASFDSLEDVMAFVESHPLEGKDEFKKLGIVMLMYDVIDM